MATPKSKIKIDTRNGLISAEPMSHVRDYTLYNDDYGIGSMSSKKANSVTKVAYGQKRGFNSISK